MSFVTPLALRAPRPSSSLTRLPQLRAKSSKASPSSLWKSKTHMNPPPSLPPPVVPKYPMRVVLSDGSTFTAWTTAPTPSTKKLTRDVTNNPLWTPALDKKGGGEDGRVGRFRKRFEGTGGEVVGGDEVAAEADASEEVAPVKKGFAVEDFDWMSVGVEEEKMSDKQRNPVKSKSKKGKK
ncbi:hypothetical protein IAT38_007984 [Cryptococcus sp. DSM 104549]